MDLINTLTQSTPFVQGGVTLMAAGWLGYQLRELPGRVMGHVRHWTTRVIEIREDSPLYEAWLAMLTHAAVRPGGPRTLEVRTVAADDEDDPPLTEFRAGLEQFWARIHGRWCKVWVGRESGPVPGSTSNLVPKFVIRVEVLLASRRELDAMLAEVKQRADLVEDRQIVEFCDKWGSRHTMKLPRRTAATLCLPHGLYEGIEGRVLEFLGDRASYERAGIPWRFGVLLHGEPGTGKTSIAHVLASKLGQRLAIVPLADLASDEDLVSALTRLRPGSIVLFEDVDAAFGEGRKTKKGGITFAGFLNCIDGMLAPHNGRIVVMSTNHVDRLDPALIRPGRIDLRVEVPLLTRQTASDYVDRLFPHVAGRHDVVDEVMAGKAPTAATLINRLMREGWRKPCGITGETGGTAANAESQTQSAIRS